MGTPLEIVKDCGGQNACHPAVDFPHGVEDRRAARTPASAHELALHRCPRRFAMSPRHSEYLAVRHRKGSASFECLPRRFQQRPRAACKRRPIHRESARQTLMAPFDRRI
jgi:hypothetical protein